MKGIGISQSLFFIFTKNMVKEITTQQLQEWLDDGEGLQLIDVRTERERLSGHLAEDVHIPVADILSESEKIAQDKTVVIYCRSGIRSYEAVRVLQEELGHPRLYNLKRGILAWRGALAR